MCVCQGEGGGLLTLRGCCRKGLCMQQIQSTLVLLVFLLHSRGDFLGATTFPVVQLATFGQQPGSSGFGRGLDHGHQARTFFLTTGVLLKDIYTDINICIYKERSLPCCITELHTSKEICFKDNMACKVKKRHAVKVDSSLPECSWEMLRK